ncbi:hypothetical protein ABZT02_45555 [Streptomyces sp. NPDC005402]|uniref:hypothetical protein n=1 Tax=Streptomyces sp. NPDC005402 TaxID=3155338 RepID=UPI0033A5A4FF
MNPLHSRKLLSMRCASLALGLVAPSVFTTALASPSIAAPAQTASYAQAADARMEWEIAGLLCRSRYRGTPKTIQHQFVGAAINVAHIDGQGHRHTPSPDPHHPLRR